MKEISDDIIFIKTQSEKVQVDCEFIKYQVENTSTTISNSLTNLSALVNQKVKKINKPTFSATIF